MPRLRNPRVAVRAAAMVVAAAVCCGASACSTSSPAGGEGTPTVSFTDDFEGSELDAANWNTCHWWNDGGCTIASSDELEWYLPEQVTVADGTLRLTASDDPIDGSDGQTHPYRSGMVTTGPSSDCGSAKLAITYGTVEVRAKVAGGAGLWPALWMLPADCESHPEIDILEIAGADPSTAIMHLHPADPSASSLSNRYIAPAGPLSEGWHDFRLDWSPRTLIWSIDGAEVWRVVGSEVPDEPMYFVANLAVGGAYGGDVDPTLAFPATMELDSVRITSGGAK